MKRRRTGLRPALALGASMVLLASCGGGASNGSAEDAGEGEFEYEEGMVGDQEPPGDPVEGGSLTYAPYSEPRSLDPAVSIASAATGGTELMALFDTLLRYDTEEEEYVAQLAEGIEPNDDFTEWTLTLRDDVEFSDATPLDAEAVAASQERYAEAPGAPEGALWNDNVTGISTPDDTTVVYELDRPWSSFPAILGSGPGMIVAEEAGAVDEDFEPIGAGPFTLAEQRADEELVLEANAGYWSGEPPLDELRFVYLGEQTTVQDSLESGGVDGGYFRDPDVVDMVLEGEYAAYSNLVAASDTAIFNDEEGRPGADPRVRRAIQLAVDPEMVRNRVYDGHGISSPLLYPEYSRWYSEDVEALDHDVEEAEALLEEAMADGYDGKITYLDSSIGAARDTAQLMKAALESVGFEVETELVPTVTDLINRLAVEQDYDMAGWGLNFREGDPFSKMFEVMHSNGAQTYGMPTSDEMDAALEELQAAPDDDAAREAIAEIQAIWNEDVPFLGWMPFAELSAWNENVHGVKGAANSMVAFDEAWIE